jgi:hypothetical protein
MLKSQRHTTIVAGIIGVLAMAGCQKTGTTGAATVSTSPGKSNSLFPVMKQGKWGFIDAHGTLVIPPQFDYARTYSDDLAAVCVGPCTYEDTDEKPYPDIPQIRIKTFIGKWGFIDAMGTLVINPRFSFVSDFTHGLASATTAELRLSDPKSKAVSYGFVNKTGMFVIPEQFSNASAFDDGGLCPVCVGAGEASRCGYIDTSGKFIINPQFYSALPFENGLASVLEHKGAGVSYIDRGGHIVWKGDEPIPSK